MRIELNGEPLELAPGARLTAALERLGAASGRRGIAVAVDGEVVPRDAWTRTELREGQRIEVVGAIQGG